jgi:hypothetical protein
MNRLMLNYMFHLDTVKAEYRLLLEDYKPEMIHNLSTIH